MRHRSLGYVVLVALVALHESVTRYKTATARLQSPPNAPPAVARVDAVKLLTARRTSKASQCHAVEGGGASRGRYMACFKIQLVDPLTLCWPLPFVAVR
jgi:hypothetical protein